MTTEYDGRRDKWLAYVLGELPEDERAEVEAELARHPDELRRLRETVKAVNAWACEAGATVASDVDATIAEAQQASGSGKDRPVKPVSVGVPRWVWAAAAAAMLVLAFGQVQFSVTVGGTTFAWGGGSTPVDQQPMATLAPELEKLMSQHAETEQQLKAMRGQYDALVNSVQGTVEALAHWQQVESATRYRDVQQLMQLAGGHARY